MKKKKIESLIEVSDKLVAPLVNKKSDKQRIDVHKQAAAHLTESARHHMEAAKYTSDGRLGKAAQSTVMAYGHHAIAGEFLRDEARHHAHKLKETKYQ